MTEEALLLNLVCLAVAGVCHAQQQLLNILEGPVVCGDFELLALGVEGGGGVLRVCVCGDEEEKRELSCGCGSDWLWWW